jgi:hypothetical protein
MNRQAAILFNEGLFLVNLVSLVCAGAVFHPVWEQSEGSRYIEDRIRMIGCLALLHYFGGCL